MWCMSVCLCNVLFLCCFCSYPILRFLVHHNPILRFLVHRSVFFLVIIFTAHANTIWNMSVKLNSNFIWTLNHFSLSAANNRIQRLIYRNSVDMANGDVFELKLESMSASVILILMCSFVVIISKTMQICQKQNASLKHISMNSWTAPRNNDIFKQTQIGTKVDRT